MSAAPVLVGHVTEVWRYPVKSMQGERLDRAAVGPAGLDGDRQFGVIDVETGRVASAKDPRKWAKLLHLKAEVRDGALVVTTPDGAEHRLGRDDLATAVSQFLGRAVTLKGGSPVRSAIEVEWPDVPGLPGAGTRTVEGLPDGGYFDLAPVLLVTTGTLRGLRELAPGTDFDVRRFRPNIVIETPGDLGAFSEGAWVGRVLAVGAAWLRVTAPCSRCVMTTLGQPGLAAAPDVLRAAVTHSRAVVGGYAFSVRPGGIAVGDPVWLV